MFGYVDYEEEEEKEDENEEGFRSRISSASFLMIMEECIRTFMNFLQADKEKPCQKIIKAFFGRSKRGPVDPTLVHLMKKVNTKVNIYKLYDYFNFHIFYYFMHDSLLKTMKNSLT